MKINIPFFTALSLFCFSNSIAQQTFKNEPLIVADSPKAGYAIGQDYYPNMWRISPQIPQDSLRLKLYRAKDKITFKTDKDSISFIMKPGESKSFYVKMANAEPAHTIITTEAYQWDHVVYRNSKQNKDIRFFYEDASNAYFDSLRKLYPTASLIQKDKTEKEKVLSIMNWVHHRWKHNGSNSPKANDAISILNEAKEGGRFPCFAYAIVLRDQLAANGFDARVLYLKLKKAETYDGAPGHVVTEVYLKDEKKWALIDGQFNIMPVLKGKSLNAVEFQKALRTNYDDVVFTSRDKVSKREYTDFIGDYLYYLNTALDNRLLPLKDKFTVNGKTDIMLVPKGAPNLTKMKFFDIKIDNCIYTHSIADFYAAPK